jgi:hypothetical protein
MERTTGRLVVQYHGPIVVGILQDRHPHDQMTVGNLDWAQALLSAAPSSMRPRPDDHASFSTSTLKTREQQPGNAHPNRQAEQEANTEGDFDRVAA